MACSRGNVRLGVASIVCLALRIPLFAQPTDASPELKGRLVLVGAGEQDKQPLPMVKVTVLEYGNSTITNDEGVFRLPLPDGVRGGQEVTLLQNKSGYAIYVPLFGKQRLPQRWSEIIEVRVLPKGSKLFWTDQRIEEFIERVANESAEQVKIHRSTPASALGDYILKLGTTYGFTENEVRGQIGTWMAAAKQDASSARRRGFAAFADGNFPAAAKNFLESARRHKDEESRDLERAGDSYYSGRSFAEAIDCYEAAAKDLNPSDRTNRRLTIVLKQIAAQCQLAKTGDPQLAHSLLASAATQCHRILTQADLHLDSVSRARFYNAAGVVASDQATRSSSQEASKLLGEAINDFHQGLSALTKEGQPRDWAMVQNNLGVTLFDQANHAARDESIDLLSKAAQAFRQALLIRDRERAPEDWAATQNNLGTVLRVLAEHSTPEAAAAFFTDAVEAYRQALTVYTRGRHAGDWAMIQSNLGNTLTRHAEFAKGGESPQLISDALHSYRQALLVYTKESFPQQWAMTLTNLGNALADQAMIAPNEEQNRFLDEAVKSYRQALLVFTKQSLPRQWAITQNGLANALIDQARGSADEHARRLLLDAIEAFHGVLSVNSKLTQPEGWAMAQNNLGIALKELAIRESGAARRQAFLNAHKCFMEALSVVTAQSSSAQYLMASKNLQDTDWELDVEGENWKEAAKLTSLVVQHNPRDRRIYAIAATIYQDKVFLFDKAFELSQTWVTHHPDDLDASVRFAETHFTTGRFDDCAAQAERLLGDAIHITDPSARSVLLVLRLGSQMALAQTQKVATSTDSLVRYVQLQSSAFKVTWNWSGMRRFVDGTDNAKLGGSQARLRSLLDAVAAHGPDSILRGLRMDTKRP